MDVGLLIKDFEMAAKVSAKLNEAGVEFEFLETNGIANTATKLIIVDLDYEETGNEFFINQLAKSVNNVPIIGYKKHVRKDHHEKFRSAGCRVVLPKSSLVKNLSTFLNNYAGK